MGLVTLDRTLGENNTGEYEGFKCELLGREYQGETFSSGFRPISTTRFQAQSLRAFKRILRQPDTISDFPLAWSRMTFEGSDMGLTPISREDMLARLENVTVGGCPC